MEVSFLQAVLNTPLTAGVGNGLFGAAVGSLF